MDCSRTALQIAAAWLTVAACSSPADRGPDAAADGPVSRCGDSFCDLSESPETCHADCGSACGDGMCDFAESSVSCPSDCGWCDDGICREAERLGGCPLDCPGECGDGSCEGGESLPTCPADCTRDCVPTVERQVVGELDAATAVVAAPSIAFEAGLTYVGWAELRASGLHVIVLARVEHGIPASVVGEEIVIGPVRAVSAGAILSHVGIAWTDLLGLGTQVYISGGGRSLEPGRLRSAPHAPRLVRSGEGWILAFVAPSEGVALGGLYTTGDIRDAAFLFYSLAISGPDAVAQSPGVVAAWFGAFDEAGPSGLIVARGGRDGVITRPRFVDFGASGIRPALANVPSAGGVIATWVHRARMRRAFVDDEGVDAGPIWPDRGDWGEVGPIAAEWANRAAAIVFAARPDFDATPGLYFSELSPDARVLAPPFLVSTVPTMPSELDSVWTGTDLAIPFVEPTPTGTRIVLARVTPCFAE